jgi:hypothetical protein
MPFYDTEFLLSGSAEAAVVDILTWETPELMNTCIISTNMNGFVPYQRRIVVSQEGSVRVWPKIDRPRIDIDVYGERRTPTEQIADIVIATLRRSVGYRGMGLIIMDMNLEVGKTRVPDPLQETPRYFLSVRLTTVPGEPMPLAS